MEKAAKRSTVMTHNAMLNRIFDEAEMYGFIDSCYFSIPHPPRGEGSMMIFT
jgi:hypothetical protein